MLFGLLLLSPLCLVTVSTLWVYFAVPSVGLIVVFPDHIQLQFWNVTVFNIAQKLLKTTN